MGQTALLPFRRKAFWGFFSPWKIQRLRPGLTPRTWVPKASTLPLDHRSGSDAVILKMINRAPARRPACRIQVRHANLPDRQLGRAGCLWKHPFIYIASDAVVGPGSGFTGVCASALTLRFSAVAKFLSHLQSLHIGSVTYPASHSVGTGGFFRQPIWLGPEADHPSLSSTKTEWSYNTKFLTCRHGVHNDKCTWTDTDIALLFSQHWLKLYCSMKEDS